MYKPHKRFTSFSLETVDFQDRKFGDRLTSMCSKISDKITNREVTPKELGKDPLIGLMEDLILREKGIRVKLVTDSMLAAILPFYPNKNFNMLDSWFRGNFTIKHQEEIIKSAHGKKGYVDLKNAKLGGIFSEGKSILYINFWHLFSAYKLNAGEVCAVILHELGHAFAACEYSDRFTRTNQVLANASREIFGNNSKKNLEYVYKELKKINNSTTIEEVDAIVNGDRVIASVKWHKFLIDTVVSELSNDSYNDNSFEQLADNFASRHGYGKELITGLDKLHTVMGSIERSKTWCRISLVIEGIVMMLLPFAIVALVMATPVVGIIYGLFLMLCFYSSGDGNRDNTYDDLKQRYVRIRNELIAFIKDENIPKKDLQDAIEQIKSIDNVINNTQDFVSISRSLSNIVFPSNRAARKSVEYQKQLEALVGNDLYLLAAKLRTA